MAGAIAILIAREGNAPVRHRDLNATGPRLDEIRERERWGEIAIPDANGCQRMMGKAILFKQARSLADPVDPAFQKNASRPAARRGQHGGSDGLARAGASGKVGAIHFSPPDVTFDAPLSGSCRSSRRAHGACIRPSFRAAP